MKHLPLVLLLLPLALAPQPSAAAQSFAGMPAGSAWTLPDGDGVENWSAGLVDFTQHATFAFCHRSNDATGGMLLSRFDADPPEMLWSFSTHPADPLSSDGAAEADLWASITRLEVGGLNDFLYTLHVGNSQGLSWTWDFPVITAGWARVRITRDGSRIVAVFVDDEAPATDILVFGPDAPVPLHEWSLPPGVPWSMDLADDGSRLVLGLENQCVVVDLASGAPVFTWTDGGSFSNRGLALSGDGTLLAFAGGGGVTLQRWDGAAFAPLHVQPLPGLASAIAISRDGSTCAWGVSFPYPSTETWVQCLDVPQLALKMTDQVSSWGAYQNWAVDIEIDDRGQQFAVAQAGDEPDVVAEVRAYRRNQNQPIFELNLPGSALNVDISPDGRWVLAGSREVHMNKAGAGGRVDLIHLGGDELELRGVPHVGADGLLVVHGYLGQVALPLLAASALDPPLFLGGKGELWIDPASLQILGVFPIATSGLAELPFRIPADPLLAGHAVFLQGYCTPFPFKHLTLNWLPLTFLP
jgi:hypothetical protein